MHDTITEGLGERIIGRFEKSNDAQEE